jgi:peptide deformylase
MNENIINITKTFEKVLSEISELRYAGDPVLRQPTVQTNLEDGIAASKKLEDVLLKYRNIVGAGRGLAAPQIGENVSVFITYVEDTIGVFINPRIVESSDGTNFYKELCISAGIVMADVERSEWIILEWMDRDGNIHSEKFDGMMARLFQHEVAHLRGRLNLDDASSGGIELATHDPLSEQLRSTR